MTPSSLLGLTQGSYEAYCFDEAIWYFGTIVTNELEKAEAGTRKKVKGANKAQAARESALKKFLDEKGDGTTGRFADPAAFFG